MLNPANEAAKRPKTRVLIVDDQPIVRDHLAQIIRKQPDLHVCGGADNPGTAFELIVAHHPDLVITGLALKGGHGLEFVKDLGALYPNLPVLVFSMYDESLYAERAIRAGARGFISKHRPMKEVVGAMRRVIAGKIYLSERITTHAVERFFGRAPFGKDSLVQQLSDRELEVFELTGLGHSTSQISKILHLDPKTVETYRARIKVKLNVTSGGELKQRAQQAVLESRSNGSMPLRRDRKI